MVIPLAVMSLHLTDSIRKNILSHSFMKHWTKLGNKAKKWETTF